MTHGISDEPNNQKTHAAEQLAYHVAAIEKLREQLEGTPTDNTAVDPSNVEPPEWLNPRQVQTELTPEQHEYKMNNFPNVIAREYLRGQRYSEEDIEALSKIFDLENVSQTTNINPRSKDDNINLMLSNNVLRELLASPETYRGLDFRGMTPELTAGNLIAAGYETKDAPIVIRKAMIEYKAGINQLGESTYSSEGFVRYLNEYYLTNKTVSPEVWETFSGNSNSLEGEDFPAQAPESNEDILASLSKDVVQDQIFEQQKQKEYLLHCKDKNFLRGSKDFRHPSVEGYAQYAELLEKKAEQIAEVIARELLFAKSEHDREGLVAGEELLVRYLGVYSIQQEFDEWRREYELRAEMTAADDDSAHEFAATETFYQALTFMSQYGMRPDQETLKGVLEYQKNLRESKEMKDTKIVHGRDVSMYVDNEDPLPGSEDLIPHEKYRFGRQDDEKLFKNMGAKSVEVVREKPGENDMEAKGDLLRKLENMEANELLYIGYHGRRTDSHIFVGNQFLSPEEFANAILKTAKKHENTPFQERPIIIIGSCYSGSLYEEAAEHIIKEINRETQKVSGQPVTKGFPILIPAAQRESVAYTTHGEETTSGLRPSRWLFGHMYEGQKKNGRPYSLADLVDQVDHGDHETRTRLHSNNMISVPVDISPFRDEFYFMPGDLEKVDIDKTMEVYHDLGDTENGAQKKINV